MPSKDNTAKKILKAARTLFVKNGFAGTSMAKIAKLAKVNHSLIFHHFNNKQDLWLAVKQSIVKESKNTKMVLPSLGLPLSEFLKKLLHNSIHFYRDNPDIIQMINWQRIEASNESKIGVVKSEEATAWINAFKHYQDRGDIDPELRPEFILTMILSITSSVAIDPNTFIEDQDDLHAYLHFCVERLLKSLKKDLSNTL